MEAMGQLTGGVAHDFNNLLTVILGNAEYIAEKLAAHAELRSFAEGIVTAAERGAELTRSLLAFSRKQPLMPKDIDIGRQVLDMEQLLRRTLGEHIECEFLLDEDRWLASVDPGQLTSALLNLALNARDAMPKGGKLTVEIRNVSFDKAYAEQNSDAGPGDYVMVAVTDTGCGMTAEVAARAFEPFFTTKEVGKGTGLGLSMVYGFAQQSGGSMKINSRPGRGTAITLFFPRVGTPDVIGSNLIDRIATPAGNETILLVEDDDMVRAYVENELKALGYRVIVTRNGPEALEVLRGSGQIDLLFTDVVMPGGLFGPQLAEQASRLRPGLKVLFTSGYSEHPVASADRPDARILNKPFRRHDLALMLRSVLQAG